MKSSDPRLSLTGLSVLCATILVSVASASMLTVALPDLQSDFRVSDDDLTWVVTAYLITFATGTVGYGRLADMHGTKVLYLVGLGVFALASLLIAIAPGYWWVVAGRAVQGFGGTAIPSLSMATIVRTTPPEARGGPMGATILTVGVGFGIGPLLGGALTDWWGWEAVFFGTAIASAILFVGAIWFVPKVGGQPGQTFDMPGALLLSGAITGMLIALNRLPREIADEVGLAGLVGAVPFAGGLAFRLRRAREPYVNPRVLRNRRFLGLSMVGFGAQATHFTTVVLIPLLLSRYHHKSTIEIGLLLLPGASALALTGILGGSLVNRFGSRRLILGGASLMWCGGLALHIAGAGWAPAGLSLLYVVIAGGYGLLNGPAMSAATAELSPELAGVGVGVYNLLFFLGGAISVALAGGILRSRAGLDPLDPLFSGSASEFSDAALVVVAAGAISVMLAALVGSQRTAPGEVTIPQAGAAAWPLKPRAKPNAPRDV